MTKMNQWFGVIALVGTPTTDNRQVDDFTYVLPLPVGVLTERLEGYDRVAGGITQINIDKGVVYASGLIDLAPGIYSVGINMDSVESDFELVDSVVHIKGRLMSLTVYDNDTQKPAWREAAIRVEEGRSDR